MVLYELGSEPGTKVIRSDSSNTEDPMTDAFFRHRQVRSRSSTTGHSTSTLELIPIACSLTSSATQLTDGAAMPTVTTLVTAEKSLATKNSAY